MIVIYLSKHKQTAIFIIGLAASVALVALTSINLTAQGLYYDEVHQAPAAFVHVGQSPVMFNELDFYGIPLLNMTYSGAIKSNIYGLYLKYFDSHFTVQSWRLLGIGFVAIGLFIFCIIAGRHIPISTLVLFLLLFLTDLSILLTTRHDWGPTALALFIRLLFIAVWIERELSGKAIGLKNFVLGTLIGIAIFEKISSVVLILPLFLIFWLTWHRHKVSAWLMGLLGLFVGSSPLIATNMWSYVNGRGIISFSGVNDTEHPIFFPFAVLRYFYKYPSLAQGSTVRRWILGEVVGEGLPLIEALLIVILSLLILSAAIRFWRTNKYLQMAGLMIICYGAVGFGLLLLPRITGPHHWIIGTPFHYTAIALALPGLFHQKQIVDRKQDWLPKMLLIVVALLIIRLPGLISVERSLMIGNASIVYDPSFTKIGYFAADKSDTSLFVAADWGIATQIYSLSNGHPNLVYEPFKVGATDIKTIIKQSDKDVLYLMTRRHKEPLFPQKTNAIVAATENSEGWQEIPVETEVGDLASVEVRKFARASPVTLTSQQTRRAITNKD